jgi:enoyl-CoA hydratase
MTTATQALVLVEKKGAVGVLTLNRPDALNALNHPLMDQLEAGLKSFEADASVRAVVIAGSSRAFAAGADIKEMDTKTKAEMEKDTHLARWDLVGALSKPVVAAVSGFALGGGCELALACDLIVAAENAQFGQPEISIGVIPGAGGTVRLAKTLGKALAMELVLTGRRFSAQEALSWGLVNRIVPQEAVLSEAMKLAEQLAAQPPLAAAAAKRSIRKSIEAPMGESLCYERGQFCGLFDSQDQKEGMKAFVEKRKPVWTGK